jgi:hypothetical protein
MKTKKTVLSESIAEKEYRKLIEKLKQKQKDKEREREEYLLK